ncbi:MAG: hypothetical protein JNK46_18435 [Methylobacteriaceae bacterium]|nr:hypothetical protein [Methylobacteriaceae bacterium]
MTASPAPPFAAALDVRSRELERLPQRELLFGAPARRGARRLVYEEDRAVDGDHGDVVRACLSPIRFLSLQARRYPPIGLVFDRGGALARAMTAPLAAEELRQGEDAVARLRAVWESLASLCVAPDGLDQRIALIEVETQADRRWITGARDVEAMVEAALSAAGRDGVALVAQGPGPVGAALARRGAAPLRVATDNPAILARAAAVQTFGSRLGFETALAGGRVVAFGAPFYAAGAAQAPARLAAVALLRFARHVDPVHDEVCDVAGALARLESWARLMRAQFLPGVTRLVAMPRWRWPMARAHLAAERLTADAAAPADREAQWSYAAGPPDAGRAAPRLFVEDGFLRSSGLGAGLHFPLSLTVDRKAMHFDATRASELEELLQTARFEEAELAAARALRAFIVERGLTKYNVGAAAAPRARADARPEILVAGQVPDDAAVLYGAVDMRDSASLLAAIRAARPQARIVFKEHPDIVAGHRDGALAPAARAALCDAYLTEGSLLAAMDTADEVHVISSVAGFEALMRGRRVVCWGVPFYAGWGLTEDRAPTSRRSRRLTLDELVCGALIRYPRYVEPRFGLACNAMDVARLLDAARAAPREEGALARRLGLAARFLSLSTGLDARDDWLPPQP